jgi:hypothetical protein
MVTENFDDQSRISGFNQLSSAKNLVSIKHFIQLSEFSISEDKLLIDIKSQLHDIIRIPTQLSMKRNPLQTLQINLVIN